MRLNDGRINAKRATQQQLAEKDATIAELKTALADAIRRPMGVVPASAEGLIDRAEIDIAECRREELAELMAEVEGLKAVFEKLPVTADGIRVVPDEDTRLWCLYAYQVHEVYGFTFGGLGWKGIMDIDDGGDGYLTQGMSACYSTESAARQALASESATAGEGGE